MEVFIDIRDIAPSERHPTIIYAFDDLPVGGQLILTNDHDPKPLYHQLQALRQGAFDWSYLQEGQEVWQVRIAKTAAKTRNEGNCCGSCG